MFFSIALYYFPRKILRYPIQDNFTKKATSLIEVALLAHKDSNLEMTESESVALPFGDGPIYNYLLRFHTEDIIHIST